MTLEQFRDELGKLLGETRNLDKQEVLDELKLQCECLRDDINADRRQSDVRFFPVSDIGSGRFFEHRGLS